MAILSEPAIPQSDEVVPTEAIIFEPSIMYYDSKVPCSYIRNIDAKSFNYLVSGLAGFLFFFGWWTMIDLSTQHTTTMSKQKLYYLPGVIATIAMILMNAIPTNYLNDSGLDNTSGYCTPFLCILIIFITMMASFGCLISASFILINDFMLDPEEYQWPGYGIFLHILCIFLSTVLPRFCRKSGSF
ncbi:unnamed protein product [Acanthoscelides obtectus]|uniref:Transmembrane protein 50A n=1 Tax=Acanthoscelides obtectus TaxID=200917 RepID=A0A9P0PCN9_ACAOB|nr:unnamed protein product [Acanthoscelides obtectus]CAK1655156.1 Transmembrane protein 50A [Acanthoscelides obtectus]